MRADGRGVLGTEDRVNAPVLRKNGVKIDLNHGATRRAVKTILSRVRVEDIEGRGAREIGAHDPRAEQVRLLG
jgi:hypothetical protein